MPNWKKVIVSGSDASLNSLSASLSITSPSFTGSLQGTASWALNAVTASYITSSRVFGPFGFDSIQSASLAQTASFISSTGTNAFIQNGNSFSTQAVLGTNDAQNLAFETNGTIRMIISGSNGNVGIGTTTPASKLDVQGAIFAGNNSATEGTIILQDQYIFGHLTTLGTNRSSGGPVIGYSVYPSNVVTNQFSSSTTIEAERSAFSMDGSFRWYTGGAQTLAIGTSASLSQKMILTNTGNLGIGVISPSAALEVNGEAIITGPTSINNLTGSLFGTSSWAQNALTASFVTASNVFGPFGSNSILSSSFAVSSSLAVSSSFSLTASFVNPLRQTVQITGSLALTGSITINTNGENRVLASTFRPVGALGSNLYIGHAGTTNIGTGASSSFNTSVGINALDSNTTGYFNTAVGNGALDLNNSGFRNTAIGYLALQSITNGANNTSLGEQSLYLAGGSFNVAIGSLAGANIAGFVTSSIYLGYNASGLNTGISDQTNNEIVIGANTTGAGSNTVTLGNANIIRTILRRNVGVGVLNPSVALEVSGSAIVTGSLNVTSVASINGFTVYTPNVYSLDVNGGVIIKNTGKAANLTIINADPSAGGNNAYVIHTVGGTLSTSFAKIQGYYGTSTAGDTTIQLNPEGGKVTIGTASLASPSLLTVNGNISASWVTASLLGTASWAQNVSTASFVTGSGVFGPFGSNSVVSASHAVSASWAPSQGLTGGVTNYVPLWTSTTTLSTSSIYETGANIGISTTSPLAKLHIANSNSGADNLEYQRWSYTAASPSVYSLILKQTVTANVVRYNFSMINDGTTYNDVLVLDRGNVGVGTVNPSAKFVVSNAGTQSLEMGWSPTLSSSYIESINRGPSPGAEDLALYTSGNKSIKFYTNTSERVVISGSGNVGIGVTSPNQKLDVSGRLKFRSDGASSAGHWLTANNGSEDVFVGLQGNTSTDAFGIYSGLNWRLTILNGGNVGIGITSPTSKLHVYDNLASPVITIQDGGTTAFTRANSGSIIFTGVINPGSNNNVENKYALLMRPGSLTAETTFAIRDLKNNVDRITILQDGSVGIGTASPTVRLHISGGHTNTNARLESTGGGGTGDTGPAILSLWASEPGITYHGSGIGANVSGSPFYGRVDPTNGQSYIRFINGTIQFVATASQGTVTNMILNSDGNVGIGTTTPGSKLEVSGGDLVLKNSVSPRVVVSGSGATGFPGYGLSNTTQQYEIIVRGNQSNAFQIRNATTSTDLFTMLAGGNVGIGTTSPSARLHVTSSTGTVFKVDGSGSLNTDAINVSSSGRVTIDDIYRFESGILDFGSGYANGRITWDTGYAALFSQGSNNLRLGTTTYTNAIFVTASNGNVGIGTITPAYKLQVVAASQYTALNTGDAFAVYSSATNVNLLLGVNGAGVSQGALIQGRDGTASTFAIQLQPFGGNVGIGINPSYKLDVAGVGRFGDHALIGTSIAGGYYQDADNGAYRALSNTGNKGYYFQSNAGGSTTMFVGLVGTYANKVGINTGTPTAALAVSVAASNYMFDLENASEPSFKIRTYNHGTLTAPGLAFTQGLYYDTTENATIKFYRGGGTTGGWLTFTTGNGNERVRIDGAGSVGIGNTSPTTLLTVGNTTNDNGGITVLSNNTDNTYDVFTGQRKYPRIRLIDSISGGSTFQIWNLGNELRFGTNGAGSTLSSFNILAGDSGSVKFNNSIAVGNITPSTTKGRIDAANDVVAFSTSDIRFKTNLTPIDKAVEKITTISGYEFDWIPNQEYHGFKGKDVGVIAQEIEKVLPEVVTTRDSGYKAVKYEKIVPLLIQAIKEQQVQIDELRYLLQNKT